MSARSAMCDFYTSCAMFREGYFLSSYPKFGLEAYDVPSDVPTRPTGFVGPYALSVWRSASVFRRLVASRPMASISKRSFFLSLCPPVLSLTSPRFSVNAPVFRTPLYFFFFSVFSRFCVFYSFLLSTRVWSFRLFFCPLLRGLSSVFSPLALCREAFHSMRQARRLPHPRAVAISMSVMA